jgi:4-amino-4-deoxy-L-arabinose transferase-like glycosyltransferase
LTPDSGGYIRLSEIDFHESFYSQWDFYRNPMFPFIYRIISETLGQSANTLILIPFLFGMMGVLLNYWASKMFLKSENAQYLFLAVLSIHPYVIIFQHTFLLETGIFFFISLIFYLILKAIKDENRFQYFMALSFTVIGLGYYLKSPLFSLVIPLTLIYCIYAFRKRPYLNDFKLFITKGLGFLLIAFLIIAPWKFNNIINEKLQKYSNGDYLIGLIEQAVILPDDQIITDKKLYLKSIEEATVNGHLKADGILTSSGFYTLLGSILENTKNDKPYLTFLRIVYSNPSGYIKGLYRNLHLMTHVVPGEGGATMNMYSFLIGNESWVNINEVNEEWTYRNKELYTMQMAKGTLKNFIFKGAVYIYSIIIPIAFLIFLISMIKHYFHFNLALFSLHLLILFWMCLFTLTLSGQERYVVPIHGLLFLNFIWFFSESEFKNIFKKSNN